MVKCFQMDITDSKLVITGSDPVPHDIQKGMHMRRQDLTVTHEESDVVIGNHVVHIARQTQATIHVVCDDTNVFVLLVHFSASEGLRSDVFMLPTRASRNVVNIGATAKRHANIAKYILPLHVSTLYGIGKVKALKVLKEENLPPLLGDIETIDDALEAKGVEFIANCYGSEAQGAMSNVRFSVWQHE